MAWLVKDVCGIICALLAWVLLAFAQYTLLTIVLLPQPDTFRKYFHLVVFEFFSILLVIAHLKTILTDPGSVPQKTATPEYLRELEQNEFQQPNNVVYKCPECCSVKPERAHHCSVCKRCIRKMDHHCPWVNNCIGERNQKYFVLFTLYVAVLSFHALYLTVTHIMNCLESDWDSSHNSCSMMSKGRPSPGKLILLVFLVFEALLFSLFSLIMFYMQMKAIWTDWTGIEHLKRESRDRRSGCMSLRSVCGNHMILWLSPLTKPPPKINPLITSHARSSSYMNYPV
uniref:Palmitoyltransferase n=1 Tax=Aceria tosichella TaxID=561515 RepID=A0A6G1SKI3_9ACAR